MRPLSLRIEGLRSFRKEAEIDFGDRDQVAVVGDTGAGKSSILEAMTYALYGKTSFAGQAGELMNDTSDNLRVVLRFRVSGEEWEAVRTLRRDGRGEVGQAKARLQRLDEDGKPLEQVEQVRQVNDRVEQLVGLNSEAFLRTVVLPQGRFARLLVEDAPAARSEVLRKVWPTDDLEAVGELASRALGRVRETLARLRQEAEGRPEDPKARLAELAESAEAAGRRAKEAAALAEEASQAMKAMQDAVERERTATGQRAKLEPDLVQIGEAEAAVAPVAETERRIDKEERELKQKQAGIHDQLKSLPSDDDGPGSKEVEQALAKLKDFGQLAADAAEAAGKMCAKEAEAASLQEEAAKAGDAETKGKEEKERHALLRPPLASAKEAAETRHREAVQAHERCSRLHGSATEAQAKVGSLEKKRTEQAAEAAAAGKEHAKAMEAAAKAERRLERARRAGSAAAAARGLHPGDDCPVCRRDLPEDWTPPPDADLAEAEEVAGKVRSEAQESAQRATGARTRLRGVEDQLGGARSDAGVASEEFRAAMAEFAGEFGDGALGGASASDSDSPTAGPADADGAPRTPDDEPPALPPLLPLDPFLGPSSERVRQAAEALDRHDEAHQALADQLAQLSKSAVGAATKADGARQLGEAARTAAVRALKRLKLNVSDTPPPYRPQVGLPGDPAELDEIDVSAAASLIAQAEERRDVLEYRDKQRQKFRQELEQANQAREALDRRREAQVARPLAAVAEKLGRCRDAVLLAHDALSFRDAPSAGGVSSAGDASGAADGSSSGDAVEAAEVSGAADALGAGSLPGPPDTRDPAALQRWMQELRTATSACVDIAGDLAKEAAADAQTARDSSGEVGRRLAAQAAAQRTAEQRSEDDETSAGDARGADDMALREAPTDPQAVLAAAAEARNESQLRARTAVGDRDDFAAIMDDLLALRAILQEAEELEQALTDLDKALKPGAFLKWLTLRRSRSLLANASRMLLEISGNRYAFADPGENEAQWRVLDKDSGQPRSPASLSGGEQFIASLALALGMVEMMAQSGGRLESLFLDEGFGALDRHNLNAAVEALATVADRGRMVGVISHVRAVADEIDNVLAVTRTAAGSRVEWLSRAGRGQLARSDVGSAAAAAMEGLLE